MAKHPVPKQKRTKFRTSRQYKAFQNRIRRFFAEGIVIQACPSCGVSVRKHHVCAACGNYRGNSFKAKDANSTPVTTVKAD